MKAILANQKKKITGAASSIEEADLTAGMVLVSDSEGKVATSPVTSDELDYLAGVTSGVQAQLTTATGIAKAASSAASTAQTTADSALTEADSALELANAALPLAGGTMTGSLILSGDPTSDLEAATKQYVDNIDLSDTYATKEYVDELVWRGLDWGDEDAIGDSTWWADLKTWISTKSNLNSRSLCVGKTKKVTLTTTLLGTTTHLVRCIGADQDGEKTLTFQTVNGMPQVVLPNNALWPSSKTRTYCQNYYSYFPGKNSIKTVAKGTCAELDNQRDATVTYNNETVWLPSEREMGLDTYSPISTYNSTTTNAECTYGYNESYSYYADDASRIKNYGDDSTTTVNYWERSRHKDYTYYACAVSTVGQATNSTISSVAGYWCLAPAFVIG